MGQLKSGGGGASGSSTFTGLTDTPSSYAGQGSKLLRVNSGADAVEFVASDALVPGWTSFTPVSTWVTNATHTGHYRVVNGVLECFIKIALTGAPTATGLVLNLPSGMSMPSFVNPAENLVLGNLAAYDASPATFFLGVITAASANASKVIAWSQVASTTFLTANVLAHNNPITFANGDYINIRFSVPVIIAD